MSFSLTSLSSQVHITGPDFHNLSLIQVWRPGGEVREGKKGGWAGHWSWDRASFLMKGWYWPGRSDVVVVGGVAEGGHRAGEWGWGTEGSLALNLFHMTHTHMAPVWTLSVCLTVSLPPPFCLSLSLDGRWGRGGGGEVDISQPQQELCDDRGQAMSHTRDSGGSPYRTERASLNTPLPSLPISLCLCTPTETTHTTAENKHTHCVWVQNTSSVAAQTHTNMSMQRRAVVKKKKAKIHIH